MDITIQERRFTFASEYEISGPGTMLHARKDVFAFPARMQLSLEKGPTFVTIQGRFSVTRGKYDLRFADGRDFAFQCEKLRKGVYLCQRGDDAYRLYRHRGLRYSVFQNGRQIAAITRSRKDVRRGNRFEVRMNSDADLTIVASMVLAMNASEGDEPSHTDGARAEYASRRSEDRKFDETWQPS